MKKFNLFLSFAFSFIFICSCGKDDNNVNSNPANLAFINACKDCGTTRIKVDTLYSNRIAFQFNSDKYLTVKSGSQNIVLTDTSKLVTLGSITKTMNGDKYYTLVSSGTKASLNILFLEDDLNAADTTKTYIRFVNVYPDGSKISVLDNSNSAEIVKDLANGTSTAFMPLTPSAKFDFKISSNSAPSYPVRGSSFLKGKKYTVYFTSSPSTNIPTNGVFINK